MEAGLAQFMLQPASVANCGAHLAWQSGFPSHVSHKIQSGALPLPLYLPLLQFHLIRLGSDYSAWLHCTLFSHVGRFHDPGICDICSVGPSNKVGIFVYYSYIHARIGKIWGVELYSGARCARITIHSKNIGKKHFLSQYCSLESLWSITTLSLKLFTIFLLFKLALFIIRTSISFFLFSKFLPLKLR
jgi:hypothetical protein